MPQYIRRIDTPTGKVYIDPNTGIPTMGVPPLGLTQAGLWVPFKLDTDGTLFVSANTTSGVPYFSDFQGETTPGLDQVLINETVPLGDTRQLSQVIVVTRVTGIFTIVAGGEIIGSGRTGPAGTGPMSFNPVRPLSAGTPYQVIFTSRLNSEPQSVECYLQASDVTSS